MTKIVINYMLINAFFSLSGWEAKKYPKGEGSLKLFYAPLRVIINLINP